ncbi:uncharacterized protein LOC127857659 [Dreissena polymorpha]|uniref:B box-type domain-containing protein n=1 Tax=Dreissena polymorpha TaxID=45954 RepID=A0A9D3YV90_DREPO|nr:uncharacterized protein LOC127857659 [Dreissena polymorpha]XP_052250204.1 uncharacterized protein LOC127857659 [Dreissena polymorpha]XP_052250205.1 uncharacterized protein LOC127857659 [Dreissena polymorpha]XP_052250206.1 uncharacterized protein LOC127857659 [Dreissena polymorpha]XP_052250207.1 uncharacterized protein LOC127857659 [Dreissena polymorpha]KAH3706942.1 hypothetical protein DPMN_066333 [Dreissena polymorpha]
MAHALKCGPCLFEEVTVDPKHFCVDCREYLCTACAREHRRHKVSREHKLLGETELPQDVTLFEEMKKLSNCPIHQDVELDQYCKSHNVSICLHCLKSDHRLCENRVDLIILLEDEYASENLRERIIVLQRKCQVQVTETMNLSEAANTNGKEVQQHINTLVETLRKNVENLEKKLNKELESSILHVTEPFRRSEQTLSKIEKKALSYENLFDLASKFGTMKQNAVLHFLASKLMKELEEDDLIKKNSTVKIKCVQTVSTEDIVNTMNQCDVVLASAYEQGSELFSDEALDEGSLLFPATKTRTVATQVEQQIDSNKNTSKKSLCEMKIMYDSIKLLLCECKHNGGVPPVIALDVLTDGRILLLHQKMIKVYSLKLILLSCFNLNSLAKDMCVVEEKKDGVFTVAFCFGAWAKKIMFLEYNDGFREKYVIDCKENLQSVTMLGHHLLVVHTNGVQLLDISTGHVCYAFDEKRWARNGSNISANINRIRACKTTKKIAVACQETLFQVKIDDGECQKDTVHAVCPFVWKYRKTHDAQPEIKDISDVKWDSQGNIYVANGNGVYQFCLINGVLKERALITMRGNCSAIAIDEHRNRIVVGYSDSNLVHVYEYK